MVTKIHNEDDLDKLRELEGDFILRDDIEISGEWEPIGDEDNPFEGTLDGRWHTISGVDVDAAYDAGFFSRMLESEVRNLNLSVDVYTTGLYAGGLVGYSGIDSDEGNNVIENVHVTGDVETLSLNDHRVGGITGRQGGNDSVIRYSVFDGTVRGGDEAGGIIGRTSSSSSVNDCYAEGSLIGNGGDHGGGVVGSASTNSTGITNVFSAVDIDPDGYDAFDMIVSYAEPEDVIQGYYNKDIGTSEYGVGLTTDEMQGTDNPPEYMDDLFFSEGRDEGWVTREDDYPAPARLPTEVIEIHNQEELEQLRELTGFFVLRDDVEIYGDWEPVGDRDNRFIGSVDGDYNAISGVSASAQSTDSYNAGFFSHLYKSEIKNLVMTNLDVYADGRYAGGLVGFVADDVGAADNTIENVSIIGEVEVEESSNLDVAGGIVGGHGIPEGIFGGEENNSVIKNSSFEGDVYGVDEAGGMVGRTAGGTLIRNCYVEGTVTGVGYGVGGGIAGESPEDPEEISKSISVVELDGFSETDMILAGTLDTDYEPDGYYNEDLGSSDYGVGLTTDQMQGVENPPKFMDTLDFSEDGVWTARENDYPTFRWLEIVEELDIVGVRMLRGGYSSKRLSVGRRFHGQGTGTSMIE